MEFKHKSVLLNEVLENMNIVENGIYVDGTLGGAGHSKEILKRLKTGTLIGIDRDLEALNKAVEVLSKYEKKNKVLLVQGIHENIPDILDNLEIDKVDGILLDLGMSSYQIDNDRRGFSYMKDAPLDMRMDQSDGITAKDIVNQYEEKKLAEIFKKYGDERYARQIARNICRKREEKPINTTLELVSIIDGSKTYSKEGHKAKKVFQALRIEVNGELELLKERLLEIILRLKKGGRILIITFHSLEDKLVKKVFKEAEGICSCPPDLPVCACNYISYGKVITKKGIIPTEEEKKNNSRSKSARLRIFERN